MQTISKPYNWYCNSLTQYSRLKTREVKIGELPVGGNNPIRIQSMTTTVTMDTMATVEQSIRIFEAGADYVRITAPSIKEAKNLANIKKVLKERGFDLPLIADIHFTPNAAIEAARLVEKVRVNPGNYADKKKFQQIEYTDAEYAAEIERIYKRFAPLVEVCKTEGTAMRIGTNHGSLSDRIMSRYGDTALGMVESALEFVRICEDLHYHDIVLSMKASNTQVMVQAYRLLINKLAEEEIQPYPLHLGVTEAGEAEDGRIKSAVGIGALMDDGIGDTIRVSLTEEPELEIPVCKKLVSRYNLERKAHIPIPAIKQSPLKTFEYERRASFAISNIGNQQVPVVIADFNDALTIQPEDLKKVGYEYRADLDKWNIGDQAADYIFSIDFLNFELPGTLKVILPIAVWEQHPEKRCSSATGEQKYFPIMATEDNWQQVEGIKFIKADCVYQNFDAIHKDKKAVLVLQSYNSHRMPEVRRTFFHLINKQISNPVIVRYNFSTTDVEQLMVDSGTDFGGLFIDGLGDGIWMKAPQHPITLVNETAFYILQASRTRISKTEYISCPSCGRTLFDLQETTAMIRAKTHHLKGIKIGIMGCIVNGPGEMADADYGYVGSGPGKITLYKGKEVIKKNIEAEGALEALIELIKDNGDWVDLVI